MVLPPVVSPDGPLRPFCLTIACGRRHSAVVTFGGAAFAWGRDVALPAPPPLEARTSLDAWHTWRTAQQARMTTCDRPRRLALGRLGVSLVQPLGRDGGSSASGGGGGSSSSSAGSSSALVQSGSVEGRLLEVCPIPPAAVVGLAATPSATLLQLDDGRTVCAGGWAAHEARLPERIAEAEEAAQRRSELPPLRKVARGFCFNVALSHDGRVYVWRHSGLFPTGATERVPREPYLALPPGEVVVDIAVGEGHVVALTEHGRVWTFGWQQRSALGRGSRLSLACAGAPARVAGLEGIVQVGAGSTYSLCLDADGSVWMFGEGPCVAGAFGDPAAIYEPRRVPAAVFGGRRVLAAACGDGHVLVLAAWDPHRCLLQAGAWHCERTTLSSADAASAQDDVVLGA